MRHTVVGLPLDALTVSTLHQRIIAIVRRGERARVLHLNAHAAVLAHSEASTLRGDLEQAEIVFCDGAGVRVAGLLAGIYIPPRITYADWLWEFADFSAQHGISWFLLGGVPGRAEAAAAALTARVPNLSICGTHHGYFDREQTGHENAAVIDKVNKARPQVLLVGFGMPIQERWVTENWHRLDVNVALTGGAALDYVSGATPRPPRILRMVGFEWLGRMIVEPRRLWRRYAFGLPRFFFLAVTYAARAWAVRIKSRLSRSSW